MLYQKTLVFSVHSIVTFLASSAIYFSIINLLLMPIELGKLQPIIALIIVICGLLAIVMWLRSGGLSRVSSKIRFLFRLWMFCVLSMFLVGIMRYESTDLSTVQYIIRGLNQDYLFITYVTLVFIFLDPVREDGLESLFLNFSKFALIAGLLAIFTVDEMSGEVAARSNVWTLQYHLWWLSSCIFSFSYFNSYVKKERYILGYGVLIVYVIFGILVLKRVAIVNLAVVALITTWVIFTRRSFGFGRKILVFIGFYGGFLILYLIVNHLFGDYLTGLFDRFSSIPDRPENLDRIVEGRVYFKNATLISIITGQGLNNYVTAQILGRELTINALHIGLYDIVYKGGLIYSIFILSVIINVFKLGMKGSLSPNELIAVCVGITYIISLFYEMSFSYVPSIFFYLVPIIRGFNYK